MRVVATATSLPPAPVVVARLRFSSLPPIGRGRKLNGSGLLAEVGMCYSAMVKQGLTKELRWMARIQTDMFEEIFRRRLRDDSVKVAKALEANFYEPQTPQEARIKQYIDEYRRNKTAEWEADIFKQRKRLADAERSLKKRETKKALDDKRIANHKIEWNFKRIADLRRTELEPDDSRIFPFWYAPVMVMEDGEYVIKPMRYHCRPNGKPASYDTRYPGLYNARRDSLEKFWKDVFGQRHAIVTITSFFENVPLHDYEKRPLRPGEKESNVILHFNPRPPVEMLLACLWDRWKAPATDELYSFAVVTDEPPPEVAATGHNRCPIPLKPANVTAWLTPEANDKLALQHLLDDREQRYYEHQLAA